MKILWIAPATRKYMDDSHSAVADYINQSIKGSPDWAEHTILGPEGSVSSHSILTAGGRLVHEYTGNDSRSIVDIDGNTLAEMLRLALNIQEEYDVIINTGHDWLSYYRLPEFRTRYMCVPNLVKTHPSIDRIISYRSERYKSNVAFISKYQRMELQGNNTPTNVIGQPFYVDDYHYHEPSTPHYLMWAGRIFREKGLHHAAEISKRYGLPLRVAGTVTDQSYFNEVFSCYGNLEYLGELNRVDLNRVTGTALAFLQTQDGFDEAFGRVTVESRLSGTPVIAYPQGANIELVQHGIGGFIINGTDTAVSALRKVQAIDRIENRKRCISEHSTEAFWQRLTNFLES
ncbi:glycosyltransferase family 4 protein [Acidithiobacillus sp. CV18-2]|uniref:Glycosyltransferase family 4 protein n=1 Tax=Igneacidithiobacillus copahuensis TaxID=2724909 RepID=A0AAE3CKD5_9PROT|nr:glycosyltransferase [Igneacidithiobacillus copahuensis]MBU2754676.1 glycosyltransferase family 4 protein [Acidithiobacillus sp. CV18-3]MBU2756035.1 glycosyltransferase family 4 protein [Acidithiobacillus sp. BN09-2]MBU2778575.1 glycosyltransferase family 4 protein [Acidithiobacillus sp. CV18-2]MBU2795321.1 glycosyltransferase family 4 protein [Acidithiobacillus sp. VAN18-2]MBU2798489.1 glycosyltransferase family 4 protein [Acidithiobacillus sp. VAN18-4]